MKGEMINMKKINLKLKGQDRIDRTKKLYYRKI